jgi:2-hydroxy-3-keto-5-methylthiopentenyl-1-phosphate phosphatase
MVGKKTLVVDFDGTIVKNDFPRIGKLKPGVKEALKRLSTKYEIAISSCRNNAGLPFYTKRYFNEMVNFLNKNKVPYDWIDDGTNGKPVGVYYIDDRAISFRDNWDEIADTLMGI